VSSFTDFFKLFYLKTCNAKLPYASHSGKASQPLENRKFGEIEFAGDGSSYRNAERKPAEDQTPSASTPEEGILDD
jgi:hypothetical protein